MFERRKKAATDPKGPEPLGEILSRLFTANGWGRKQDRLRLEQAWAEAVGPEFAPLHVPCRRFSAREEALPPPPSFYLDFAGCEEEISLSANFVR